MSFFFLSCLLKESIGFLQFPNRRAQQPLGMLLIGGDGTGLLQSPINLRNTGFLTGLAGLQNPLNTMMTACFKVDNHLPSRVGQQGTNLVIRFRTCHTKILPATSSQAPHHV